MIHPAYTKKAKDHFRSLSNSSGKERAGTTRIEQMGTSTSDVQPQMKNLKKVIPDYETMNNKTTSTV